MNITMRCCDRPFIFVCLWWTGRAEGSVESSKRRLVSAGGGGWFWSAQAIGAHPTWLLAGLPQKRNRGRLTTARPFASCAQPPSHWKGAPR